MHPLHNYVAMLLGEKLKARKVIVWYDPRCEFVPFIDELRGGARMSNEAVPIKVAGIAARLAQYDGSMFELPPDMVYPALVRNTRLFLDLLPEEPCERCLDLGAGTGIAAFGCPVR